MVTDRLGNLCREPDDSEVHTVNHIGRVMEPLPAIAHILAEI